MVRYTIKLSKSEVEDLTAIINKGRHTSQAFRSAYILLNCDKGDYAQNPSATNEEIAKYLMIGVRTIDRIKKKFIEEGFDSVLQRRPSSQNYTKKMDGDLEAKLVTLCCSEPPEGYAKWSLRLLADKLVELNYVDSISHVSVRRALKKTNLSLGK
jgi:transposase